MGIAVADSIAEADCAIREALELVERETRASGYLVGAEFSVADLTAAALLALAVGPPGSPMERPRPEPRRIESWRQRWAELPGSEWVREMYRLHRSPPKG